ncbi:hypothetical protein [Clostridium saccharobutylicum]|uniref:hypothetical protein n=1 Tax=Clostridium saccharobutylicum TaxID=169679 RepID=UPI001FA91BF7|nr:hypothetical protein [Clostridium saccharobutylicum]
MGRNGFYLWALKENINARAFYESNEFTCEIMQKQLVDVRYILKCENNDKLT